MALDRDEDDLEDDPRVANIYRKMRMLVGASLLVMGVGFAVVVGVIVYRLARAPAAVAPYVLGNLDLPDGARIVGIAAESGRVFVAVGGGGGGGEIRVLDAQRLTEIGRIVPGPPSGP